MTFKRIGNAGFIVALPRGETKTPQEFYSPERIATFCGWLKATRNKKKIREYCDREIALIVNNTTVYEDFGRKFIGYYQYLFENLDHKHYALNYWANVGLTMKQVFQQMFYGTGNELQK